MFKPVLSVRRVCATVLVIGLVLPLGLVSVPAHGHPEHRRYKKLVRDGVSIAVLGQVIRFHGLVGGGERMVVDFRLAGDGYLRVDVKGSWKRVETLKIPAKAGARKLAMARLPPELGPWSAAEWTVTAFDDSGQEIDFRFFGIGVGDRAVGSTGIYDVTFEPFVIRGAEPADWGFWSHHDFERSQIAIYRQEQVDGDRQEALVHVLDPSCLPRRGESCQGAWDGRDQKSRRSPGRYRLAVKAWQEGTLEKDWIIGWSEDEVEVQ